jgi:hypothetical protein
MKFKFLTLLCITPIIFSSQSSNNFLNPTFLQNTAQAQKALEAQGFKKVFFTTDDNLKLCGLLRDSSATKEIKGTIIFCAGFYPGTKEGMASFYTLFADQPYNFLLFDARGHKESEGSLFSYESLKNYGTNEYQDVVAAVKFLNNYNREHHISPNIIIHGICSGAFHAIKACDFLQHQDMAEFQNIKGIIFDSGWLAMTDIVEPTLCAEINKRLAKGWFSWLIPPLCYLTLTLYQLILRDHYKKVPGICDCIKKISCPILFIHCINDPYVPVKPVQNLVTNLHCPHFWWIMHDAHANFHTQEPEIYRQKIMDFLNRLRN